jgi:methylmalonyl-CoA/ethylmalonyl-CoA epimerase
MAKLRHIALSVPDPDATAEFFMRVFGMTKVGDTDSPLATGVYVSDGTINMALLKYKNDESAGGPKDAIGVNHFGFWVDDLAEIDEKILGAGGRHMLDLPEHPEEQETLYYEVKYRNPDGIIFDVSQSGWGGARK